MNELRDALVERDIERLSAELRPLTTSAIATELVRVPSVEQAIVFRLLSKDRALRVFERLGPARQAALLNALTTDEVTDVIERLDPDDRVRLLDEVPAGIAARLLQRMSPEEHERTTMLLGYEPERAGRMMTPEYTTIPAGMTAGQAIDRIRRSGEPGAIDLLYVIDDSRRPAGVVALKELVLAGPDTSVLALVEDEVISATTDEDQEIVARRLVDNDLLAVPILDSEGRLVGVVTVDDAIQVLEREDTEDVERIGGATPLDQPYLSSGVLRVFRARVGWLLVLFLAEALTGTVMRAFETSLEAVVALAFFIPLLIDTGGNAGSQTASTIVRAMAVGEVRFSDAVSVVWKEARVGLLLGVVMAAVGIVRAITLDSGTELAVVVGVALVSVVLLATLVGSILPIVLDKLGVDPAVVSAPFITTFVDGIGLFVYFSLARAIMGV